MKFPIFAKPRIYGLDVQIVNERPYDDRMELIKHPMLVEMLSGLPPMIGKVNVDDPREPKSFESTLEALTDSDSPKFMFWAYDVHTREPMPFKDRLELLKSYASSSGRYVGMVLHKLIANEAEFDEFKARQLLGGFDGIETCEPETFNVTYH